MRVLVIDTEENTTDALLSSLPDLGEGDIQTYSNPIEAAFDVEDGELHPDVAFVNTDLQGESGIQIAIRIKKSFPRAQIIFLADDVERNLDVYEVDHVWLLTKPIEGIRLQKAWERAMKRLQVMDRESFAFEFRRIRHIIACSDILYFEKNRRKVMIHADGMDHPEVFYSTMAELQGRLDERFFRCHESYIVNLSRVESHGRDFFIVGGHKIPISRRYAQAAEELVIK